MASASETTAAYQRFAPALVRKAERILRNREDAIDVVHALFADLLSPRHRREQTLDLPYLYRAVTNRALNVLRDARGRERLLARQQAALVPPARLPETARVIGLELLAALCDRLDERHCEVLVARFVDEMTQEEISACYGISRKTVGKQLARIEREAAALAGRAA